MTTDDFIGDDLLRGRVPFSRAEEMANLLGRIEATLIDIRGDIQASTKVQEETNREMGRIDRRVVYLESREDIRKRTSRIVAAVVLALLIPTISAANHVYTWFSVVNDTIFPRKLP
jgi:hypothetical protein